MKLKVDQDKCIGCGACVSTCPNVFDFNDEGLAHVIVDEVKDEDKENAMDALKSCPTDAIEEVKE